MSQNIERALAYFEKYHDSDPDHVLACWRALTGARLELRCGTYELTYAGVRGTASSGAAHQLIGSWKRAAKRRLDATKARTS